MSEDFFGDEPDSPFDSEAETEDIKDAIKTVKEAPELIERLDELCIFVREVRGFRNKYPNKKVLNNKKEPTKLFFDHYLKVVTLEDLEWIDKSKITESQVKQLNERIAQKKRRMDMPIKEKVELIEEIDDVELIKEDVIKNLERQLKEAREKLKELLKPNDDAELLITMVKGFVEQGIEMDLSNKQIERVKKVYAENA